MPTNNERILLVESDPEICDQISRLQPLGYQVLVVSDASNAIQQVIKFTPDLIISNINLPGLSGKDLMVALTSQGLQTPLIVRARNTPIEQGTRSLLGALADYASLSLVNAHLFRALQVTADSARAGEQGYSQLLAKLRAEVKGHMQPLLIRSNYYSQAGWLIRQMDSSRC